MGKKQMYVYSIAEAARRRPASTSACTLINLAKQAQSAAANVYNKEYVKLFSGGAPPTGTAKKEELLLTIRQALFEQAKPKVKRGSSAQDSIGLDDDGADGDDGEGEGKANGEPGEPEFGSIFAGSGSGFDIGGFDPEFGAGYLPTQTAASSGGVPKRSREVKPLKPEMPDEWEDGPCWLTWCVLGPLGEQCTNYMVGCVLEEQRGQARNTTRKQRADDAQKEREARVEGEGAAPAAAGGIKAGSHRNSVPTSSTNPSLDALLSSRKQMAGQLSDIQQIAEHEIATTKYYKELERFEKLKDDVSFPAAVRATAKETYCNLMLAGPPATPTKRARPSTNKGAAASEARTSEGAAAGEASTSAGATS